MKAWRGFLCAFSFTLKISGPKSVVPHRWHPPVRYSSSTAMTVRGLLLSHASDTDVEILIITVGQMKGSVLSTITVFNSSGIFFIAEYCKIQIPCFDFFPPETDRIPLTTVHTVPESGSHRFSTVSVYSSYIIHHGHLFILYLCGKMAKRRLTER